MLFFDAMAELAKEYAEKVLPSATHIPKKTIKKFSDLKQNLVDQNDNLTKYLASLSKLPGIGGGDDSEWPAYRPLFGKAIGVSEVAIKKFEIAVDTVIDTVETAIESKLVTLLKKPTKAAKVALNDIIKYANWQIARGEKGRTTGAMITAARTARTAARGKLGAIPNLEKLPDISNLDKSLKKKVQYYNKCVAAVDKVAADAGVATMKTTATEEVKGLFWGGGKKQRSKITKTMRGGRLLDGMKDDPLAKEIFKKMSPMLLLLSEIIQFGMAKNDGEYPPLPAILPHIEMIFGSPKEQIQYCSLVYLFVQTVIAINKVELLPGAWVGSPNQNPLTHTNLQVGPDWKWGGDVDCDTDLDGVGVAAKKGKLFLSMWNTTAGVNQGRREALTEADDTLKWIWAVDEEGGDYCYWTFKKEGADWVLNDLSIVRPDIFDTGGYKKEAATQVPPIGGDLGTDDNLAPGADEEWVVRYSHRRWREIYPKWIFDTNNAVDAAQITDW